MEKMSTDPEYRHLAKRYQDTTKKHEQGDGNNLGNIVVNDKRTTARVDNTTMDTTTMVDNVKRSIAKIKEKKEFQSDDEFELNENADGENLAQLRKYEVNKMKYFYAVVHCNS